MASKGNLYLSNQSVSNLYEEAASYGATVQSALYSQYQNAVKISVSNYLRGDAADAFKNYISRGAINIISEFLDIVSDVTMVGELITEAFYQFECTTGGKVEEPTLDYINQTLNSRETTFNGAKGELNSALSAAAQYISVQPLSLQTVNSAYTATRKSVKTIREDMYSVDDSALQTANELMDRINALHDYIDKLMAFCYSDDGRINADNLSTVQDQDWFYEAGNITLYLLLQEDPFAYCAGEVTFSEDQWAAGLCSDIYAYAGYSYMSASGEAGVEDGTAFAKGAASVLSANGYAQFTDYLNANVEVNVDYVEGEVKVGWSDNYKGFKVSAGVGGVDAEGKVVIGSENFNAYVKGEVEVLTADAKAAFEFEEETGEFAIGFDASATGASAKVKGGFSFFSVKTKDDEQPLAGFSVSAKATAGAGAAFWIESKTGIETEYVNVNATTVNVDLEAFIGVEFSVTLPTLYIKWPW